MIRYLLDTNTASYAIRGEPLRVRKKLVARSPHEIGVSSVTQSELRYGVIRRGRPAALAAAVDEFLRSVEVLPWTAEVADIHAEIRAANEKRGKVLGAFDLMIAAQAIFTQATLVTHDRSFQQLGQQLRVEDWAK